MKMRLLPLLALAAVTSGCTDTVFESQPSDSVASCDTHFVGKWRLLSSDSKDKNDRLFVIVDPDCKRWHFIEDGKEDESIARTTHFAFAQVGGKPLLTVKVDPEKKNENDAQARWHDGYFYFRYEFADQEIHLHAVDDRRVAHLIIDDKIQGRSERVSKQPGSARSGNSELHNFVAGKPEEMARVAQLDGVFADADVYVLKPASKAEIFKRSKLSAKP